MKLPLTHSNCKIEIVTDDEASPPKTDKYDATSLLVLFFTVFLATASMTYILYQAHLQHTTQTHQKSDEYRKLVQSIFVEYNELLRSGGVVVEVQVLDKNRKLLWFKPIDEESWRDEERVENEIVDEIAEVGDEISRRPSLIRHPREIDSSRTRAYVVSHQTQFVNCDRFKPIPRGKYLVPPSLYALHKCYEYGVTMEELDRGILRGELGGTLRYNLPELYVACHEVFNSQMDELTSELRADYERCKWSGALEEHQQKIVEERFATHFDASNAPLNLEISSPSYPPTTLPPSTNTPMYMDPRWFVECSHVEMEYFEDSYESPSPDALQRCRKFGVTYDELRRGIIENPNPEQTREEVGGLYLQCQSVFTRDLDYLTNELKQDYRRCKRTNAIAKETQDRVENKFYEVLYEEKDVTRRPERRRPTTSSTTEIVPTTTTANDESKRQTTVVPPTAFANNCKRVENKDFYICIKITTYNGPVINV